MQDLKDLKRFSRGSNDRGGQAPALRARKGFSSPCAVREQALPNYSRLIIGFIGFFRDYPKKYHFFYKKI